MMCFSIFLVWILINIKDTTFAVLTFCGPENRETVNNEINHKVLIYLVGYGNILILRARFGDPSKSRETVVWEPLFPVTFELAYPTLLTHPKIAKKEEKAT